MKVNKEFYKMAGSAMGLPLQSSLFLTFLLFLSLPLGAYDIREMVRFTLFLNLRHSVGLHGRGISPSQGRYLTQTQNKHRHACLEWGSNPRLVLVRAKTVHALMPRGHPTTVV
jgi:hypothetical protein